jgi:hypothetical protein
MLATNNVDIPISTLLSLAAKASQLGGLSGGEAGGDVAMTTGL